MTVNCEWTCVSIKTCINCVYMCNSPDSVYGFTLGKNMGNKVDALCLRLQWTEIILENVANFWYIGLKVRLLLC